VEKNKKNMKLNNENNYLLATILDHTQMMVACLDPDMNFIRVNRAYAAADDKQPSFFPGKNHFDLYPNGENEEIFRRVVKTGKPHFERAKPFQYERNPERGVSYWDWDLVPVKGAQGKVEGLVLTLFDVTKRINALEDAKRSENQYKIVMEQAFDGIFLGDLAGNFLEANPCGVAMLGYSRDELLQMNLKDIIVPENLAVLPLQSEPLQKGEAVNVERQLRCKNGTKITVRERSKMLSDGRILTFVHDVTEQKRAEDRLRKSEEKFKAHYKTAPMPIYTWRREGDDFVLIDFNQEALKFTDGRIVLFLGKKVSELYADDPDIVQDYQKCYGNKTHHKREIEYRFRTTGETKYLRVTYVYVPDDMIMVYTEDITEPKLADAVRQQQQRKLEETIAARTVEISEKNKRLKIEVDRRKESEKHYKELFHESLVGNYITKPDGTFLECNQALVKIMGYASIEELLSINAVATYPNPESREKCLALLAEKKVLRNREEILVKKDGQTINIISNAVGKFDENGQLIEIHGQLLDVTNQKKAERALDDQRTKLKNYLDVAGEIVVALDRGGNVTLINTTGCQILGCDGKSDILGKNWFDHFMPSEEREKVKAVFHDLIKNKMTSAKLYENEIIAKDGQRKSILWHNSVLKDNEGKISGTLSSGSDITDQKRILRVLQKSEERYRMLVETMNEAVVAVDENGIVTFVNDRVCPMFGYSKEEVVGVNIFEKYKNNFDYKQVLKELKKRARGVESSYDISVLKKDGQQIFVHISPKVLFDDDENFKGSFAVIMDVTQQKISEEQIRLSEQIIQNMAEGVFLIRESDHEIIFVNSSAEKMFGYNRGELMGKDIRILSDANSADETIIHARLNTSGVSKVEFRNIKKDGDLFWSDASISKFKHSKHGDVIISVNKDITERKHAEEELKYQKALLECQGETSLDGVLFVSSEGKWLWHNRRFFQLWGIPANLTFLDSKKAVEFAKSRVKNPAEFVRKIEYLFKHPNEQAYDEIHLKDGRVFERYSSPVTNKEGFYYGRIWYYRDITERKQAQQEIRKSLEEKEIMLGEIHHRVKNNLQIIASLLNLQSNNAAGDVKEILYASQDRIQSMALIHEMLYQSKDFGAIDLVEYLKNLMSNLYRTYIHQNQNIHIEVKGKEAVIDLDKSITCGLLVNELVSNALKHAFPKSSDGHILLSLKKSADNIMTIEVRDNGVGFANESSTNDRSLGLKLIQMFCRQLKGKLKVQSKNGTRYKIVFHA